MLANTRVEDDELRALALRRATLCRRPGQGRAGRREPPLPGGAAVCGAGGHVGFI